MTTRFGIDGRPSRGGRRRVFIRYRSANAYRYGVRRLVLVEVWPGGRSINSVRREVFGWRIHLNGVALVDVRIGRWAR